MNMKSFDTNGEFAKNYKFLIGSILPRPIAVVSTVNENGTNNVAPFSFFTAVSAKPMIIAFSPMIKSSTGEMKDTPRNIFREKEFVVSFVSEEIIDQINTTSVELPYGEDEFKLAGLTPIDSDIVKAKRILESKIHFECIYRDHLSYGDEPGCGQIITGEVVKVHINEDLLDSGRIDTSKFKPVGRGAGNDWILCDHLIQRERLMQKQIQK
ncbi:flavin reductase family protein [Halobacteriovorax sp. JY17]|uniref:flavin reductase family protein n=1 Tax=Halobacteriovorax sp. JY17 TaxID=2014617 RepID=UPI0025C6C7CE|nr:flavin reductase family protein [Halobacteriovorax sp. JY17]